MTEEQKNHTATMFDMIAGAFEHMVAASPQMAGLARFSGDLKAAAQYLRDTDKPPPGKLIGEPEWPSKDQAESMDDKKVAAPSKK